MIKIIENYYFPIFIFLVILTGYWDSFFRKFISIFLPILIIAYFLIKYKIKLKLKLEAIVVILYIITCMIASIYAYNKIESFFFSFRIIIFFLLIAALYHWMNTYRRYLLLVKAIVCCGVILILSIYFFALKGDVIMESSGAIRSGGIFSNVNSAGFVSYIITVYIYFLYLEKKKKRYIFFILFFTFGLFLTGSRASILALVATLFFYNFRYKITKKVIGLSFVGFILMFSVLFYFKDKVITLMRLDKGLSARDVLYNVGVNIAKDHPYTGIGLGNLKDIGRIYIEKEDIGNWQKNMLLDLGIQSSHNVFIETAAEIGFFGAIFFILMLLIIGWKYQRNTIKRSPENKNFYYLFWGIFMGIFIRNFFESNGIINRGWITIDIFFWITYVIFLRFKQWKT